MDEHRLLKKLKTRKRDALEKAVEQYLPYIRVITYNIIGNVMTREDMEEVISDVFIALWTHAEDLDDTKGSVRTYLGATARNCAINKLRDLKPHLPLEDYTAMSANEPQSDFEKQETNHMLWNMVTQLGELDNEIFLRYYQYGEKVRDIAKHMGISTTTVKTRLCRGRQRLKKIIEQGGSNDE